MVRCATQGVGITRLQHAVGDQRRAAVAVFTLQLGNAATGLMQLAFTTDIAGQRQGIATIDVEYAVINDIPLNAADITAVTQL